MALTEEINIINSTNFGELNYENVQLQPEKNQFLKTYFVALYRIFQKTITCKIRVN